jgi:hypothetical protein
MRKCGYEIERGERTIRAAHDDVKSVAVGVSRAEMLTLIVARRGVKGLRPERALDDGLSAGVGALGARNNGWVTLEEDVD